VLGDGRHIALRQVQHQIGVQLGVQMPNPTGKGLKPNKPGERRGGRQAGTRDLRTLVREAAEETGLIERVPVLDKEGKPTGRYEFRYGAEGEKGYLKWVARNHPGHFMALYGKLIPLDVNAKVEEKPVVRYETVEERRAAMIAKGWAPSVLAALEEAMEPKFLRDMREKERMRKESEGQLIEGSPENDGQGEAN
jgi:hypothetical protein